MGSIDIETILTIGVIMVAVVVVCGMNNQRAISIEQNVTKAAKTIKTNFYAYNHFKVPVDILITMPKYDHSFWIFNIKPDSKAPYDTPISNGSFIKVYKANGSSARDEKELLGESIIDIPNKKAIRAIHVGLNSSHYDIAISSEPVKSPLGTALTRLRIVNTSPRTLRLNENIVILPHQSFMYLGEYENGIPIGMSFKDQDGILKDFVVDRPISDLFMGLLSDIDLPLYSGAKFGNEFDDSVWTTEFLLSNTNSQYHRGSEINKAYIPKNW